MFNTLQRLLFRKRKYSSSAGGNSDYYGDNVVEDDHDYVEEEEEEEGDMKDWTKVIPVVPNSKKSASSSSPSSSPTQNQQQQPKPQQQQTSQQHIEQGFHEDRTTLPEGSSSSSTNMNNGSSSSSNNHNSSRDFVADHDEKIARQLQEQEEEMVSNHNRYRQQLQQQQQQQQQQRDLPHLHNYIKNNPFFNEPTLDPFETPQMYQRISVYEKQRRQQQQQLNSSIQKTFKDMVGEQPDKVEQDQIQRAIELSMLDCALVPSTKKTAKDGALTQREQQNQQQQQQRPPYQILGISEDATQAEIKTAYRKLCRLHHPDKATDRSQQDAVAKFQEISRAYKDMMQMAVTHLDGGHVDVVDPFQVDSDAKFEDSITATAATTSTTTGRLKSTAHWDQELQDHRRLVNDLFQADGMDLHACVRKQQNALELLGLTFRDAGATNRNERDEIITNSCFYLSLAVSMLWGIGVLDHDNSNFDRKIGTTATPSPAYYDSDDDFDVVMAQSEAEGLDVIIGDQALILKRGIEASVVKAHPEWAAQGKVGEEVQAFSDFLVYVLDTLMADIAVVVFDNTSGFCDIYKGENYDRTAALSPQTAQANTLTLRYIPGHYQPLIPSRRDARRPLLQDIVSALDNYAVMYAVCDGN